MAKAWRWSGKYFVAFVVLLLAEIAIALFVTDAFVRPYVGDALVVIVIYCFVRSFLPAHRLLPAGIFLLAALVETLQYFDIVAKIGLQNSPILATMLGATFDWMDFVCYFCGCIALALWQAGTQRLWGR